MLPGEEYIDILDVKCGPILICICYTIVIVRNSLKNHQSLIFRENCKFGKDVMKEMTQNLIAKHKQDYTEGVKESLAMRLDTFMSGIILGAYKNCFRYS